MPLASISPLSLTPDFPLEANAAQSPDSTRTEGFDAIVRRAFEQYLSALAPADPPPVYAVFLAALERPLLEEALKHCRCNLSRTASLLGINRATLRTKLKQYQIDRATLSQTADP